MSLKDHSEDKRFILAISILTSLTGPLMVNGVNVALPAMGIELSMNAVELGWISQASGLSSAIFLLPLGRLADVWGIKRLFVIGLSISTASALLSALSTSFYLLIFARVIQGVSLAVAYSNAIALLTSGYPAAERGKVLGINAAMVSLGFSIGPTVAGVLTQNLGWRSVFLFYVIFQLPSLYIVFGKVKGTWAEAKGEKFDIIGAALFCIMLFCIMYGFSSLLSAEGPWIITLGFIVMAFFIAWELKTESPILDIHLLTRSRLFAFSNLTQLLYYCSVFAIPLLLSLYLQYISGLSPQDAGFTLVVHPISQAVVSPFAGRLSDRIQPRVIVSIGIGIVFLGLLLLVSGISEAALPVIIGSLVLIGAGHGLFTSPNTNAVMSSVERKYFGVVASMDVTTRNIGITLSMGIVLLLFSLYMGTAQITPEYYCAFVESIKMAFMVFSGLCLCCVAISAARGKLNKN
jgi:MFS family permease